MNLKEAKQLAELANEVAPGMSMPTPQLVAKLNKSFPDYLWEMPRNKIIVSERPKPKPTDHASTSPGPVDCQIRMMYQQESYPRSCPRCGLGPCPFFNIDGTSKYVGGLTKERDGDAKD